jgi:hypothetical protein
MHKLRRQNMGDPDIDGELHENEAEYNKVCWCGLDTAQDKDH